MTPRKSIQIGCAMVLALAMYIPAAHASVRNQLTEFTFSKPVQVSDSTILPAGTYWFRLADSTAEPSNTVEIFDQKGKHIVDLETEVTDRGVPTGTAQGARKDSKTELDFAEGSDHDTLIKWFYAGIDEGHKFTYSGEQQKMISAEPVVKKIVPQSHDAEPANLSANEVN